MTGKKGKRKLKASLYSFKNGVAALVRSIAPLRVKSNFQPSMPSNEAYCHVEGALYPYVNLKKSPQFAISNSKQQGNNHVAVADEPTEMGEASPMNEESLLSPDENQYLNGELSASDCVSQNSMLRGNNSEELLATGGESVGNVIDAFTFENDSSLYDLPCSNILEAEEFKKYYAELHLAEKQSKVAESNHNAEQRDESEDDISEEEEEEEQVSREINGELIGEMCNYLPFFKVNRRNAELMLLRPNVPVGTYLLRPIGQSDDIVMSIRSSVIAAEMEPAIAHVKIEFTSECCAIAPDETFHHIDCLVAFYSEFPISFANNGKHPVKLSTGYSRKKQNVELQDISVQRSQIAVFEQIGVGNFGEVFRGRWRGQDVAVKCLKQTQEGSPSTSTVLDEVRTMAAVLHENLVKLIAVSVDESPFMIITEFMNHGALLDCLQGRGRNNVAFSFSFQNLLDVLRQVACGMAYLEAERFLHRDLRAANCLVHQETPESPWDVKIADFGLSAVLDEDNTYESHSDKRFPVRWTAPEALLTKRFSNKSDVWSFGILAFEVLSLGALPYEGKNNFELWRFIDSGGRIQLSDLHAIQKTPAYATRRPNNDDLLCPEDLYVNTMANCWLTDPVKRPSFDCLVSYLLHYERQIDSEF